MEFLLSLLTDPKILGILTLPVVCMVVEAYALYRIFQKYDSLQEARIRETKEMNDEYIHLSQDINKTLDAVLTVIGRNGNGTK